MTGIWSILNSLKKKMSNGTGNGKDGQLHFV